MTRPLHKWTSAEIAQYARDAGNLTPEEMPVKMEHRDYAADESTGSWRHRVKPTREPAGMLTFILAGMVVVLVSLFAGHVLVKGIANLAHYNFWEIAE